MNKLTQALDSITTDTVNDYHEQDDKFLFCCNFLQIETYAPYAEAWVQAMTDRINEIETNKECAAHG